MTKPRTTDQALQAIDDLFADAGLEHGTRSSASRAGTSGTSTKRATRIQVRPGLHCAPAMHQTMGTHETGGTVRFSLGAFTTQAQIDAAIAAVEQIAESKV